MATKDKQAQTSIRPRRADVFLFSQVRTASNLLTRLLSTQPGWTQAEYHFLYTHVWAVDISCAGGMNQEYRGRVEEGFRKLEEARQTAIAEDKSLFVKNHVCNVLQPSTFLKGFEDAQPIVHPDGRAEATNPTIFSDEYLLQWKPIFLVRHPLLTVESWYKAESRVRRIKIQDAEWICQTTYRYIRQLYDWYTARAEATRRPIVIDADSVIAGGSAMGTLCDECGMDVDKIAYEWEARPIAGGASPRTRSFLQGIRESTAVDGTRTARDVDAGKRVEEWKTEFGEGVAEGLRGLVERAMADYEYMKRRAV
ncbi:hypothetical protein CDD82_349 [Ophiocordyceps australis]|uniref:Sulfotransferase domain-containing protein n=1 Tax=Ophiocordyceps australis TaxID=1399860 RepID=A0A2C5YMZ3_9HYPO|nr:hypothetical protein CDD82_349 [Ophiocordyceps australis]